MMSGMASLRTGDVVEVRPAAEIMATLDENASLGGLPFMPEMLEHVGKRYRVSHRVEKICDTAGKVPGGPSSSRRMRRTVFLEDLRCDGSGHDGCQAGCRMYWREEWLRPVGDAEAESRSIAEASNEELAARARGATRWFAGGHGITNDRYRCQATEAPAASEALRPADPRQYVREITGGNATALHVASVLGATGVERTLTSLRLLAARLVSGIRRKPAAEAARTNGARPSSNAIRPGDRVRVRPWSEIAATLDAHGRNRGLYFDDREMTLYCGGTYDVRARVERFIDDRTGKMIELSTDCLILEGVVCTGEHSKSRLFCPREIYSFWREAWLVRTEGEESSAAEA
jgi:hypothetical protein